MAKSKEQKIAESEELKMINEELKKASAISALGNTEGGKLLRSSLLSDVVSSVNTLCAGCHKFTQQEFVALCESMKCNLDLARAIIASDKNAEYFQNELESKLAGIEDD